jgi:hypothetical protein
MNWIPLPIDRRDPASPIRNKAAWMVNAPGFNAHRFNAEIA